jgi:serine/threonine protein kinase/tetratricopeptide (TPR) repeat protein
MIRLDDPPQSFRRRYVILEILGVGGMGAVFRARDRLGGYVALKRIGAGAEIAMAASPSADARMVAAVDATWTSPGGLAARDHAATAPHVALGAQATRMAPTGASLSADDVALFDQTTRAPLSSADSEGASVDAPALRLLLTQEFQTLASVRHPNIIVVLDYGFDGEGQPYFTMELLERARTILRAGQGGSVEQRVGLLEQVLRALLYLHRRGLVHRDLKPANVLVVGEQVKVLDFGLAVVLDHAREHGLRAAGTPAYMAPELFLGFPASKSTDLYAVGVIAYELFAGRSPFTAERFGDLRTAILEHAPDLAGIDPRVAPVVARLLAKDARHRYADAAEVMAALADATGQPLRVETAHTRESFLQAARLVGRDAELAHLSTVLDRLIHGKGSAWLLGGESGVGKSRLLEELRARALVRGVTVVRGQEVSEGGGPYQVWREVIRWLLLLTDPADYEAAVFKALVPDVHALLDRDVPDAAEVEPDAAQMRLASTVVGLLQRAGQPMLILLEDIHWARSDSLKLLSWVATMTAEAPVLVVASYRDDERPSLHHELPAMQAVKIERLDPEGIAELSRSMIGKAGARPEILARLVRETEGNPFFLVEVVRALADEAGQLDRIGQVVSSPSVSPSGLSEVIRRRLEQAPARARPLLAAAAVAGRQIDVALLRALEPETDLDEWLASCTDAAVLDAQDGRIRFAHDKLREGLLASLDAATRRDLHRRVALAIEAVTPDATTQTAALAHHWAAAGDDARAAVYCGLAGEQALQSSAYREAAAFFEQALRMLPSPGGALRPVVEAPARATAFAALAAARRILGLTVRVNAPATASAGARRCRARWLGLLSDARGRLGDHLVGARYGEDALRELGLRVPEGSLAYAGAIAVEALLLGVTQARRRAAPTAALPADAQAVLVEATRIQNRVTETCFYTEAVLPMLWSGLRALNLGESADPSADLARGYLSMGIIARVAGLGAVAESWCGRGVALAERTAKPYELAWVVQRDGAYRVMIADWSRAEQSARRALDIAALSGDRRQWEESRAILAFVAAYQGRFTEALGGFAEVHDSGHHREDRQVMAWGAEAQAWCELRLGRVPEATALLEASLGWSGEGGPVPDILNGHGLLALAHLHRGERRLARESAERALALITARRPVAYWIQQSIAAVAEVFVTLLATSSGASPDERARLERLAARACKGARTFAQVFPFGAASALLWRGHLEQLTGAPRRARASWKAARAAADRLGLHYERAQADLALGRFARDAVARRVHLRRALDTFLALAVAPDVARARAELDRA